MSSGNYLENLYQGRMGRLNYFLSSILLPILFLIFCAAIILLITFFVPYAPFLLPVILLVLFLGTIYYAYHGLSFYVRRLHDLGLSGWFLLLLFVPLVNIILYFILLFKKGDLVDNTFGSPACDDAFWDAFFGKRKS